MNEVKGVTLRLFDSELPVWEDAERVANKLGIDWELADFRNWFGEDVISPYIAVYKRGHTPNPCSLCNRVGKTKYLFDMLQKAGASRIVTGHYANIREHGDKKAIFRSSSDAKDQTYYLALMDPFHIQFMLYPLSGVEKTDIRTLASKLEFPVANKRDSYEACFLKGEDYRDFLNRYVGDGKAGRFTLEGADLGGHKGVYNYTVGQRRGLDISHSAPLYVKSIDTDTGEIALSEKDELFSRLVRMKDTVFLAEEPVIRLAHAKLRHKMVEAPCLLEIHQGKKAVLLFDTPQFAPAPGQVTAIYDGDRLMGGGVVY